MIDKKAFFEDGYIVLRNVIPLSLIKKNLDEIESLLEAQWRHFFADATYPGKDEALIKLMNRNINYRRYLYEWLNKRMVNIGKIAETDIVKKVLLELDIKYPIFQSAHNRITLPAEDHFLTEWHQDIGVMDTENSIVFWLPMEAANQKNGAISVLKGSHKVGILVPEFINYRGHSELNPNIISKFDEIWLDYDPGDLLIFHTKTIHNAKPNRTDKCRWAGIFRFDDALDTKYFDLDTSPLSKGYIMKKSEGTVSGFVENNADIGVKDEKKQEVMKTYKSLGKNSV